MKYGFIVTIPEHKVRESELDVEQTAIVLMRKDGRFDQPLGQYREGLVQVDYERQLATQRYLVRFVSNHKLIVIYPGESQPIYTLGLHEPVFFSRGCKTQVTMKICPGSELVQLRLQ
jgi:hypothetical protein